MAVAYATLLIAGKSFFDATPRLVFLLVALFTGAVYVSTINDITDIEVDKAAGKINRMSKIPEKVRWLIPAACAACGALSTYFLLPDLLSASLSVFPWIVFSIYSIK